MTTGIISKFTELYPYQLRVDIGQIMSMLPQGTLAFLVPSFKTYFRIYQEIISTLYLVNHVIFGYLRNRDSGEPPHSGRPSAFSPFTDCTLLEGKSPSWLNPVVSIPEQCTGL